jgi:hypothetical protein
MHDPAASERDPSILFAMANPAKRNVTDDSGPDPATSTASDEAATTTSNAAPSAKPTKVVPPKAKVKAKASPAATPARHTMPKPVARGAGPSPRWVPVLMFALWAIGLLLIILNYMGVLPGAEDGGNGWYLVAGLVSILAGIMVATQYR